MFQRRSGRKSHLRTPVGGRGGRQWPLQPTNDKGFRSTRKERAKQATKQPLAFCSATTHT